MIYVVCWLLFFDGLRKVLLSFIVMPFLFCYCEVTAAIITKVIKIILSYHISELYARHGVVILALDHYIIQSYYAYYHVLIYWGNKCFSVREKKSHVSKQKCPSCSPKTKLLVTRGPFVQANPASHKKGASRKKIILDHHRD